MTEQSSPTPLSRRERINKFFRRILDLTEGLDRKGTIEKIRANIETRGANVWLLVSAIMIASIGLDLNSQAVIIGAMLISPLMSPILGMGLSIGINDKQTLWLSVRHFGVAIAVSLLTSVIYFTFTPFGTLTPEIAARTSPTVLDVMVAFFGGIAGIVATSRKDLINAVPGVAIATALLPPLCVTGFGIANLDWDIAAGSFYLFFLNSTFVSLATYMIVRILRFPYKRYVNQNERRRNAILMVCISFILVIPSFFKLSQILEDANEKKQLTNYLDEVFKGKNIGVIDWDFQDDADNNHQELNVAIYSENYLPNDSIDLYKQAIKKYGIKNCEVNISQLKDKPNLNEGINIKIGKLEAAVDELQESNTLYLKESQETANRELNLNAIKASIEEEIKVYFPEIEKYSILSGEEHLTEANQPISVVLVKWNKDVLKSKNLKERESLLASRISEKLKLENVSIMRYE